MFDAGLAHEAAHRHLGLATRCRRVLNVLTRGCSGFLVNGLVQPGYLSTDRQRLEWVDELDV